MVHKIDLTGKIFGEMEVLSYSHSNERGSAVWLCRCSCGVEKTVAGGSLRQGLTKTCGAKIHRPDITQHGHAPVGAHTSEYRSWASMNQRCRNPKNKNYPSYGGKGITVCDRWRKFANFLADMGPKPTKLHTLERHDNSRGYEPSNCRWATRAEQCLNRAYTKITDRIAADVRESKRSNTSLAKEYGVHPSTISAIRSGRNWKELAHG